MSFRVVKRFELFLPNWSICVRQLCQFRRENSSKREACRIRSEYYCTFYLNTAGIWEYSDRRLQNLPRRRVIRHGVQPTSLPGVYLLFGHIINIMINDDSLAIVLPILGDKNQFVVELVHKRQCRPCSYSRLGQRHYE